MNVNDMTRVANNYTDENFSPNLVLSFINDAISRINTSLKCSLPLITSVTDDYEALDTNWIYSILIPYACYGIKMNDGSLHEADRFLAIFNENFETLKMNKFDAIKEEYRNPDFSGIYKRDLSRGINQGWFRRR